MNIYTLSDKTKNCKKDLAERLSQLGNIAVAFSGGTDSSLLLKAAAGIEKLSVVAITVKSPLISSHEFSSSVKFVTALGIDHIIVNVDILSEKEIVSNPPDRCYYCKKFIFTEIISAAAKRGIAHVLDGTHHDDLNEYRPGLKAISELGVISPLKDAGFRKENIRELARYYGLTTWDADSSPCLATRIPHGTTLKESDLRRIEEGELFLRERGFRLVRLRLHGNLARIEVPQEEIQLLSENNLRREISGYIKSLGFDYVSLDLDGYRTGSMNKNNKGDLIG